jgi:hypothetical protein
MSVAETAGDTAHLHICNVIHRSRCRQTDHLIVGHSTRISDFCTNLFIVDLLGPSLQLSSQRKSRCT